MDFLTNSVLALVKMKRNCRDHQNILKTWKKKRILSCQILGNFSKMVKNIFTPVMSRSKGNIISRQVWERSYLNLILNSICYLVCFIWNRYFLRFQRFCMDYSKFFLTHTFKIQIPEIELSILKHIRYWDSSNHWILLLLEVEFTHQVVNEFQSNQFLCVIHKGSPVSK